MHLVRRIALAVAACAALGLAPLVADTDGLGLDVSPGKLEISIPAGQTYNIPITIRNTSESTTHVQATMVDFGLSQSGSLKFDKVGTRRYSLMKWASIRPREFDTPSGTSQQVQLTLQIPKDEHLNGEYAGIVFFQTRPTRGQRGMLFAARIGSKIYETIPGTVKIAGSVAKMKAFEGENGEKYRVLFRNTGNAHVYARGNVQVKHNGVVIEQIAMPDDMLVERGQERLVEVTGKRLESGSYQAEALMDYGGSEDTGGAIAFTVP